VLLVKGTYDDAFELCLQAAGEYSWYNRNTGYNPYMSEGKKTVSFEICEQLGWQPPDRIFVSVGDGCIIGGVHKGLKDLLALGWIEESTAEQDDPRRRAYRLSRSGRVALQREMARLSALVATARARKRVHPPRARGRAASPPRARRTAAPRASAAPRGRRRRRPKRAATARASRSSQPTYPLMYGSSASWRARFTAVAACRWWRAHIPESRLGKILPRSVRKRLRVRSSL